MPGAAYWTPLPHDWRLTPDTAAPVTFGADAGFESGYKMSVSSGGHLAHFSAGYDVTLGDGDEMWMSTEVNFGATTWAPGVTEEFCQLGGDPDTQPDTQYARLALMRLNAGTINAGVYDANGTFHGAGGWTPSASTHYVLGAYVKRYVVGADTKVDVVLYDVDGTTNGGTPVALATLTGDVITGADKTLVFPRNGSVGQPTAFGKGGTGLVECGNVKVNVSSGVTLSPTGSAWTQAAVDQVRTAMRNALDDPIGTRYLYAIGLLTVYDDADTSTGWPTVSTIIDWRLPTSNQGVQWTPSAGDNYACVDDAYGTAYATMIADYVSAGPNTQYDEDQYGYPALSLSSKTVLAVGIAGGYAAGAGFEAALNVNGTLTAYLSGAPAPTYFWWDKVTVGSGFGAAGFAHSFATII